MSIVGSGRTHLHTQAILAVLAADWSDEWASFKLLQVRSGQVGCFCGVGCRAEWGKNVQPNKTISTGGDGYAYLDMPYEEIDVEKGKGRCARKKG